jgi:hypothetical protein
MRSPAVLFVFVLFTSLPVSAQWLTHRTPGIPRTSDGKPNLTAPAPRGPDGRPDLSGLWRIGPGAGYENNIVADLKPGEVQPWVQALYRQRVENFVADDPAVDCLPGGPRAVYRPNLAKFVQTPTLLVILLEDLAYRQVFMDGRTLEADPNPSWMGYSVGRWDGDTLVIDSNGFNERSWLDEGGHAHTEALRITERYNRRDFGHMDLQVTFTDLKAYVRPWTISFVANLVPDTELLEEVCNESPRDRYRFAGGTGAKPIVSPDVLKRYVGTYEIRSAANVVTSVIVVKWSDSELLMDVDGVGNLIMVPQSETIFVPPTGGSYEFVVDAKGTVTGMRLHGVSGTRTAVRTK